MKSRIAAILVVLSLVSVGRLSAAVVGDIRLPSHGLAGGAMAEARPWKCCNNLFQVEVEPTAYFCTDFVERCADTCKDCQEAEGFDFPVPLYICMTGYQGEPGPKCTDDEVVHGAATVSAVTGRN